MTSTAGMALCPEIASDLEIQKWVQAHYGFVPHPFWISHCKELYLHATSSDARLFRHECPAEKRIPIKAALRHFGLLR